MRTKQAGLSWNGVLATVFLFSVVAVGCSETPSVWEATTNDALPKPDPGLTGEVVAPAEATTGTPKPEAATSKDVTDGDGKAVPTAEVTADASPDAPDSGAPEPPTTPEPVAESAPDAPTPPDVSEGNTPPAPVDEPSPEPTPPRADVPKSEPSPSAPIPPDDSAGAAIVPRDEADTAVMAPIAAVPEEPPGPDLFAALRKPTATLDADQYWYELGQALRQLQTLEGAHFDPETGRLMLYGEYSEAGGPFHLEDLIVALRAEFHERAGLGVTIDPAGNDPTGPVMHVLFFAGAENTNLGRVMFEADRLLKCLSLGKHNETGEAVTSEVEGYAPLPEVMLQLKSGAQESLWSRFWIVPSLDNDPETRNPIPDEDSRYKAVVTVTDDWNTIWFEGVRLFVRTEIMEAKGGELVSSGGAEDPASRYFAVLLSNKYDEFAQEFPVLGELKELSKLVLLAKWLRQQKLPFDHELLYLRSEEEPTRTPEQTPTLNVAVSRPSGGNIIRQVTLLGGVEMKPRLFYANDTNGHAQQLASVTKAQPPQAVSRPAHRLDDPQGKPKQMVSVGGGSRAPPASENPEAGRPRRRKPLRVTEAKGVVDASGRPVKAALRVLSTDTPISQTTLERNDLTIYRDPGTGREILNLPVLRISYNPRELHTKQVSTGGKTYEQRVADYVYVTSPLRDINIEFKPEPEFDMERSEFVFRTDHEAVIGLFPETNTLELKDGTRLRFDSNTGLVAQVDGGGKPTLDFTHPAYEDGPLVLRQERSYAQSARPPPTTPAKPKRRSIVVRESRGAVEPSERPTREIRLDSDSFGEPRHKIRNTQSNRSVEVKDQDGILVFVEEGDFEQEVEVDKGDAEPSDGEASTGEASGAEGSDGQSDAARSSNSAT